MLSTLDKLSETLRERKRSAEEGYQQLVASVADGDAVDADDAAAALAAADRTPDQLRADVQLLARRRALAAQLAAEPEVGAALKEVGKSMEDANAELKRAQAAHLQTVTPLKARQEELHQRLRDARSAESELRKSAPERLVADAKRAAAALARAEALATKLRGEHREARESAESAAAKAKKAASTIGGDSEGLEEDAKRWVAKAARIESELEAAVAEAARLSRAAAVAESALLEP